MRLLLEDRKGGPSVRLRVLVHRSALYSGDLWWPAWKEENLSHTTSPGSACITTHYQGNIFIYYIHISYTILYI